LHFYFINVIQDGKKNEAEFKDWKILFVNDYKYAWAIKNYMILS
jgi:hypothetical protein